MAGVNPSSEHTFKILINRIAEHLSYGNCESLVFLYEIKKPSKDDEISGLEVMKGLLHEGLITYKNPDSLLKVLTEIGRQDLVSQVNEYKHKLKKDNKRSNTGSKSKPSAGGETAQSKKTPQSGKLFSLTLTVSDQTSVNLNHLEEAATETHFSTKEKEVAFANIMKYGEKFKEALNTFSAVMDTHYEGQLSHTIEESTSPIARREKPLPPPKPRKKRLEQPTSLPVNQSLLTSSESIDTVSSILSLSGSSNTSSGSGSSFRSEENEELKQVGVADPQVVASLEQESHTGDSGFNDGTWGETALPMKSRKNAISKSPPQSVMYKEDPDYAESWLHAQETHSNERSAEAYMELTAETREEEHIYS